MASTTPRRSGGRTHLDTDSDQLVWILCARESLDQLGEAAQVANQLTDMRKHVADVGGRIGLEIKENNVSAFRRQRVMLPDGTFGFRVVRPEWDRAMTALRRGEANALCLPNIDRGMRDPRDLEDLIDLVEQYGVLVVGLTGTIDLTTDSGISAARSEVNQRNQESRNISRRMQTGNRHAALKGLNHGGANRPFGWRSDRVRINKREAKHILREVPRLLAGVRPTTIAIEWTERGIPTAAGASEWRAMTIVQIFSNPRLCGWRTYLGETLLDDDGKPVRGVWEPIITEADHAALMTVLRTPSNRDQRRSRRGRVMKYLLSPFVRCGLCNARMHGAVQRYDTTTGEPVVNYRCPAKGWGGCGKVSRLAPPIEEYVTALVLADQSRVKLRESTELAPWNGEAALKRVQKQIRESTVAWKAEQMSGGRYFPLIAELEDEERQLKAEKRKYEAKRQAREVTVPDLEKEWNRPDFTLEQKHAAIAESISAIVIHPAPNRGGKFTRDQVAIVWNDTAE